MNAKELSKDYMRVAYSLSEGELFCFFGAIQARIIEHRKKECLKTGVKFEDKDIWFRIMTLDREVGRAVTDLKESAKHYSKSEGWGK